MNRKGFTLIELLAVIVLLGLILTFSVPKISNAYKESKLKSEEMFINQLSKSIESYVSLEGSTLIYEDMGTANKTLTRKIYNRDTQKYEDKETNLQVEIYKSKENISVQNIINDQIISETDYINPGNKDIKCNKDAKIIEVYKDSDYVYCHKIKKAALNCLTEEFKSSIASEYAIDTCIWK